MTFFNTFRDKSIRIACALVALVCLSAVARAQNDDEDVIPINSNLVILNVGVADQKGRALTNLSQSDFNVFEDGVKQSVVSFEPSTAPFSLVMLLDMSGSTRNFRPTLKQSAIRFLDALSPEDRVEVVIFSNQVKTLQGFTSDRRKVAFAIDQADGRGDTSLYKALRRALADLSKEGKRRKAIVVLTDGLDTDERKLDGAATAEAKTGDEAVATVKPDQSAALRSVLDSADRLGVTIYPLALPSADPKDLLPLTPQQAAIYSAARTRMQTLADRTGGRIHEIRRLEDMGRLYAEVAAEMRTLYSLAYQSSNARPRDGKWRAITVEVARPDAIARTRPGYYAR
ncbi:MAG: VWA domain-containing protein [Acidobacteria bacterium]|nr:VWA domain-containing protein [Acidobacteriota bacterium]